MDDIAAYLANNLRHARGLQGLTQQRLAHLASIPRSTIAQLETGGGNPTLSVLIGLAGALRLSLEELVAPPVQEVQHFPRGSLPVKSRDRAGRVVVAKLLPHPVPGMEIERMELKPGGKMTGTPHNKGTREYLYCERGTLTLWVAGERTVLSAGGVATFPGDRKHAYHNDGQAVCVAVGVVSLVPQQVAARRL